MVITEQPSITSTCIFRAGCIGSSWSVVLHPGSISDLLTCSYTPDSNHQASADPDQGWEPLVYVGLECWKSSGTSWTTNKVRHCWTVPAVNPIETIVMCDTGLHNWTKLSWIQLCNSCCSRRTPQTHDNWLEPTAHACQPGRPGAMDDPTWLIYSHISHSLIF